MITRADAVKFATWERDSLLQRAAQGGDCREDWERAAAHSEQTRRLLEAGRDREALAEVEEIYRAWRRAASCQTKPLPRSGVMSGLPWWAWMAVGAVIGWMARS
jgi:hypothetical protein